MAEIYIDGKGYEVQEGRNLLSTCLSLGFEIPYFCWHPALHSVGSCRLCAVKQFKDENDHSGRIVMSCMTPVSDGMRISIDDQEVREFRRSVIEWLMLNHPHDCPVCDEGGECHLQDMTVLTGHNYRRTHFRKRTYRNQYLGPFLNHEMNRCIQCYRCVRFYKDYAGGKDLDVFGAHHHVYFGRFEDGVLENPFSGNLVEICPTGVFTDKTFKNHYTRKWDLQTAPSLCVHCGVGCNTIAGERCGLLRRVYNRYHGEINGYFLCDRGRFGYEFVNSPLRIRTPIMRTGEKAASRTGNGKTETAGSHILRRIGTMLPKGKTILGIGSPRASLEANFALRTLVGPDRFYSGMSTREHRLVELVLEILTRGPAEAASLSRAENADAVFILGEDILTTAPRLELALRQSVLQKPKSIPVDLDIPLWNANAVRVAIEDERGPLSVATPFSTSLDEVASRIFRGSPEDLARLGFAVARAVDRHAPAVRDPDKEVSALAAAIARGLEDAERPLIVSGTGCGSEAVLQAAANVAWALCRKGKKAAVFLTVPECNSLGVLLLGGKCIEAAFRVSERDKVHGVVVVENDLFRRAEGGRIGSFLRRCGNVLCIDHLQSRTTESADLVLPAATFAEGSGTLINNEGRAQRYYRVFAREGDIAESWKWLRDIMSMQGLLSAQEWENLDRITARMAESVPLLESLVRSIPGAEYRYRGLKIPRQSHRYSGRTSIHADVDVHEPKCPDDSDSPLAFSMEGTEEHEPPSLIPRYWAPHWNSVQSLSKFQEEVNGPLRGGDPGVLLLNGDQKREHEYFSDVPQPFHRDSETFMLIPVYLIFGSEELSRRAPAIAERAPVPFVGIAEQDARARGFSEGQELEVETESGSLLLSAKLIPGLVTGLAVIPVGLKGIEYVDLPCVGKVKYHGREVRNG
jgi:NADH-quinone oxidoreductase subunit G